MSVALIAHLSDDSMFASILGQQSGFFDRVRERLLTVDMFSLLDRDEGGVRVGVVGGGDGDSVDVMLLFFEHHPEVLIAPRLWKTLEGVRGPCIIHVT